MNEAKIRLEGVWKSFGDQVVLRGCDLEVKGGECLVIMGLSGSGKSVTLRLILGLMPPDSGHIYVDGVDMTALSERERDPVRTRMGMVFQNSALFDSLPVWQNVTFALRQHTDVSDEELRRIAVEKLRLVELVGVEDRMPAELSGGMRKRVAIARAIASDPEIMLYDEPTTGLDPVVGDAINKLIFSCNRRAAATSVVVTHDLASARRVGDRIAVLYEGRIIALGTPGELDASSDPVVRQFLSGRSEGPIRVGVL